VTGILEIGGPREGSVQCMGDTEFDCRRLALCAGFPVHRGALAACPDCRTNEFERMAPWALWADNFRGKCGSELRDDSRISRHMGGGGAVK
jgi:hypothetical protein